MTGTAAQSLDAPLRDTRPDSSGSAGENFDAFKIDVGQTVKRLKNELDDVTITSPAVVGGDVALGGVGNYGDDILPSAAENMGAGKDTCSTCYVYMHVTFAYIILWACL